jgi:hypothetical protein
MYHISMALSFRLLPEATFAWLWNRVGIGTIMFLGGSILRWPAFNIQGGRSNLMLSLLGLLSIFREDVVHRANCVLK